eukprot:TRINITY_DN3694_c0_g1_i2.p1 TRINITY_DN3694_c0_g1~~TRINITY_DN3694_c0_g1_i2.p1  ORF type:complete len:300 (+),score=81.90 TRINITY_DN3694_c0_g1_i2:35-901(+)
MLKGSEERVALIGSGNWGSAIAKIIGNNVKSLRGYHEEVRMWVYEEVVDGENLTDIINKRHENVKYLPGIQLPSNVVAVPDLVEACKGATLLVFVVPHQFLKQSCERLRGKLEPGARAVSLIKGLQFTADGPQLVSQQISDTLGIDCAALMGANVAVDVAREQFCEATLGYENEATAKPFQDVFETDYFKVTMVRDVVGVELCGALKNVVAIGAGFVDGLKLGGNTKAAIIRIGLVELWKFIHVYRPNSQQQVHVRPGRQRHENACVYVRVRGAVGCAQIENFPTANC